MKKTNLKILAKNKYKNITTFSHHAFPQSRRDFVKLGLLAGGGMIFPSLAPSLAIAQVTSSKIPFLTFDLAGGASLHGNFLSGKQGGPEDLARNYEQNGWNPRLGQSLDRTFGIPMSAKESGILRGLKETLPPELTSPQQTFFKMASHLHFSLDDTSVNRTSAVTAISKSGLIGDYLQNGLGQVPSQSGGNASLYIDESKYKPKIVQSINDVLKITSLGNGFDNLSNSMKDSVLDALAQSADSKTREAYESLQRLGRPHEKGDPRNDNIIRTLFPLEQDIQMVQAAIVLNVIKKYTGPGVITINGCDYHNGNRTDGDQKDLEIGQCIGRAVHAAHLYKTPLFFQIITDGGMTADGFSRNWQADSPLRSMTILGHYHPTKPVQLQKSQIGYVTDQGEVDISNELGATADKGAISTIVNYLYVNNNMAALEKVVSRLSSQEIDQLLVFG